MTIVMFIGFLLGLAIPAFASRFGKILPADPGLVCAMLFHKPRIPNVADLQRRELLDAKWRKMVYFSVGWGVVMGFLFAYARAFLPHIYVYACLFFYLTALLMAVDQQYYLLPDFFTIPLLLIGITFACFSSDTVLTMNERIVGAWFGYIISTLSVFIMSFFKKGEFGAGDVKMLTAFGIWLGPFGLNVTLLLSFLFFYATAWIKKRRADAFGPALGIAGIIVFFLLYLKLLWTF